MSRWEFMRRLEELLSEISPSEREEALQYYNDYFNDAGKENEKEVMEALGSPEQVAQIVKDGLSENGGQGEFTENGFTSGTVSGQNEVMKRTVNAGQSNQNSQSSQSSKNDQNSQKTGGFTGEAAYRQPEETVASSYHESYKEEEKKGMPTWAIVLIVIACILGSPLLFGVLTAVLGGIVGIFTAIISLVFGLGVAALVLYVVAIALVIAGFGSMLISPLMAVGLLGAGCICAALGIIFMLVTVFLVGKCIPGICQGIAYIWKSLFSKKGGAAA